MYKKLLTCLFILTIFCNSCVKKITAEKEADNIKAAFTDMWDAIENHNIKRYADYIHPDFTQFGETDSVLRVGKSA